MNMTRHGRPFLWGTLLFLASSAVLLSAFSWHFMPVQSDEASLAWIGKQVSMGRIPYADFFTFYPPITLFGLGAIFKIFGASIGALRLFTVVWLLAAIMIYFTILRRRGLRDPLAAGLAFCFPALVVSVWPVSSHHWFALGFGLAALGTALEASRSAAPFKWAIAGCLSAITLLTLQSDGMFFAFACGTLLLLSTRSRANRTCLAAASGAFLLPFLVMAGILLLQGSIDLAIHDIFVWPARYYKQTGGFNDVNPAHQIWTTFHRMLPRSLHPAGILDFLSACAAGMLIAAPLISLAFSPVWLRARRLPGKRWVWAVSAVVVIGFLYLRGRPDWTHLVLWAPIAALVAVCEIDWARERWRPRIAVCIIAGMAAVGAARWIATCVHVPPLVKNVLAVDRQVEEHSYPLILRMVPTIPKHHSPVLCLPDGGTLYFFWAPIPPPVDMILPVSERANAPLDYGLFVAFAQKYDIPYILIRRSKVRQFLNQPSPISILLNKNYHLARSLPIGDLFERNDNASRHP
jgi:hypothetical protein